MEKFLIVLLFWSCLGSPVRAAPETVPLPKNGDTCFSPDQPCAERLTKFIMSAKKSIDIAIYDITLDQLVHQLILQSKRVRVRIVVDRRQAKERYSLVPLLLKAGVKVRYGRQRGIMHNKFTIVDDKMVETGSFNYTNDASTRNQENQVYLARPGTVERYKTRFERMWRAATPIKQFRVR